VAARITRGDELVAEAVSPLYNAESSTEAEWASLYYGLLVAHTNREWAIGLENDCLGVVSSLLYGTRRQPKPYAVYYRGKITDVASTMDWCGIRWIPREQNRADRLFRMN